MFRLIYFFSFLTFTLGYDFQFVKTSRPEVSLLIFVSDELTPVTRFKTADCDQIDRKKLRSLIHEYPNVVLTCEKQMTVVYPAELNEEIYPNQLEDVPKRWADCMAGRRNCHKYFFTEVSINMTQQVTDFRFPLTSCATFPEEKTTGFSEIAITLAQGRGGLTSKGISLTLPFIAPSFTELGEINHQKVIVLDHACDFDRSGSRPVASISTVTANVKDRLWVVNMRRKHPVMRFPWRESQSEVFSPKAPLVACVSEMYVPGVCEWDQEQARDPWEEIVPIETWDGGESSSEIWSVQ